MDLKELKKEIPYKWRVQSFSKKKPQATCVAYVDSRQIQDLFDEVCGPENWQCEYYEVKGNVYCKIGVYIIKAVGVVSGAFENKGEWVWKSDCGTESNQDAQKGEASDAFKRAAVKWGAGRFLYDLKMKTVKASEIKKQGNYPYPIDDQGRQIWDLTKHFNNTNPKPIQKAVNIVEKAGFEKTKEEPYEMPLEEVVKLMNEAADLDQLKALWTDNWKRFKDAKLTILEKAKETNKKRLVNA